MLILSLIEKWFMRYVQTTRSEVENMSCILCQENAVAHYHKDRKRCYLHCGNCDLVFVPNTFHLTALEEKKVYDQHQNNALDVGYRTFLSRLVNPLLLMLPEHSKGLDFGSGPGPTLSLMMSEAGHKMQIYDPFYAPHRSVLSDCYDFITATEVVEHLSDPSRVLELLWSILKPGGILGIMTKLVVSQEAFEKWHYKNDPTHISFYSKKSFDYIARRWRTTAEIVGKDVILLRKPPKQRKL